MTRRFSITFGILAFILDGLMVAASLFFANAMRPMLNRIPGVAFFPDPEVPPVLYLIFPMLWGLILLFFSVYDGRRNTSLVQEWLSLTGGSLLAGVALAGVLYLTYRGISRLMYLIFFGTSYFTLLGWRLLFRFFQAHSPDRVHRARVLIVGGNKFGREIGETIRQNPDLGLVLAGYADDTEIEGRLGLPGSTRELIREHAIDEVVIAMPEGKQEDVAALISDIHLLPIRLWVVPNYFQLALFRAGIEEFAGLPMLDLHAPAISEYQRVLKRVLDLAVTIIVLVPGLPVMGLTAIAVWLDSGAPVLFKQPRVGENGRLFNIYKFRTMVTGSEMHPINGETHKGKKDPRVTRLGRFLRRTSLDEMPQFINVLKGEMSLVGPRPELPMIVEQYEPWQHQRFAVPPGITGWWQVSGRSEKMMHLHTEDDLYYIKNYSLLLDIRILAKTIGVVIGGKGAW